MSKIKVVQMNNEKILDSKGRIWYSKPIYSISSLNDELGHDLEISGYEWALEDLPEEPVEENN